MLQLPADVPRDIGRSDRVGDLLLGKTFKSVPAFNLLSKISPELVIKETAYCCIVNGKLLLLNADFIVILAVRIMKPACRQVGSVACAGCPPESRVVCYDFCVL